MVDKELEGLIDKYTDYMECDEYHIHGDSTEEYEERYNRLTQLNNERIEG